MKRKGVLYFGGLAAVVAVSLLLAHSRASRAERPLNAAPVSYVAQTIPARVPSLSAEAAAPREQIAAKASASAQIRPVAVEPDSAVETDAEGSTCKPSLQKMRERMEATTRVGPSDLKSTRNGPLNVKNEGDRWAEWFYGQRAYPKQTIPPDAIGKAYKAALSHGKGKGKNGAMATMSANGWGAALASNTNIPVSSGWSPIGPSQIPQGQTDVTFGPRTTVSGRVSAVAVDPTNPDVVYAGGAQGGIWKSTNATSGSPTWTPLTDSQASLAVGSIAIDPANTNIVYVGTGEANGSCDSYYGQGILRTTDGGTTWTQLAGNTGGPFAGQSISKVIVDPATAGTSNATTLWASTALGFLSSGTEQCAVANGVYNGAVWRSTDSGNTWTRLNVPTGALSGPGARIHDMVLDPIDDNVLYVTVRALPTASAGGVWRSNNAKAGNPHFNLINSGYANAATAFPPIRRITIGINRASALVPATLYSAIENSSGSGLWGFYKSINNGANWSHVDAGNGGHGKVVHTTLTRQNGPSFTSAWLGRRIIIGNFVAARVSSVTNANTMQLSVDFGNSRAIETTWSVAAYPDYCAGQCFYDMTIGVDPHDATGKTVYVGGNPHPLSTDLNDPAHNSHYVWASTDGGNTWGSISQGSASTGGLHSDDHAIVFDPNMAGRVYDGNDGGLWRSDDGGASWTDLNTNLAITQFQSVALHPSDTSKILGGTQDNGTDLHDPNVATPPAWFHSDDGDGGQSLIDQANADVYLHTYFNSASSFMGPSDRPRALLLRNERAGEGGPATWFFAGAYFGYGPYYYNGMQPGDRVSFYAPLSHNAGSSSGTFGNNPAYLRSNRLYRSNLPLPFFEQSTFGPAWGAVSADITMNDGVDFLSAVAAFPGTIAGKEVVYTGSSEGRIEVSTTVDPACPTTSNCVTTWSVIDNPAVLPGRFVTQLVLAAADATANTAYATFSGFNANTPSRPGHVFKTTNGLSGSPTWTDITGDLPDVPANCIALDPSGTIYLGTDIGVFQSSNGGTNWTYDNDTFPTVAVFGLERNPNTGQLVAATHGRGMYQHTTTD